VERLRLNAAGIRVSLRCSVHHEQFHGMDHDLVGGEQPVSSMVGLNRSSFEGPRAQPRSKILRQFGRYRDRNGRTMRIG
jgi:hypothetical protein